MLHFHRLIQFTHRFLRSHFVAFVSLATISCIQGAILAVGGLSSSLAIGTLPGIEIPFALILNALSRRGIISFLVEFFSIVLIVFTTQFSFFLLYVTIQPEKNRPIAALLIWAIPGLLSLPTVVGTVIYLMSPMFAISLLPDMLSDKLVKEDFAEGWIFPLAAIGWFNLFWLVMIFQGWIRREINNFLEWLKS